MTEETERCTGHCCRLFPVPISPLELWEYYYTERWFLEVERQWKAGEWVGEPPEWPEDTPRITDILTLAPMLIPRPEIAVNPVLGTAAAYFYSCRHFDGGDCQIYDGRPHMCSAFPYGRPCDYAAHGCTRREASQEAA